LTPDCKIVCGLVVCAEVTAGNVFLLGKEVVTFTGFDAGCEVCKGAVCVVIRSDVDEFDFMFVEEPGITTCGGAICVD
jgi:hypothetical protein